MVSYRHIMHGAKNDGHEDVKEVKKCLIAIWKMAVRGDDSEMTK